MEMQPVNPPPYDGQGSLPPAAYQQPKPMAAPVQTMQPTAYGMHPGVMYAGGMQPGGMQPGGMQPGGMQPGPNMGYATQPQQTPQGPVILVTQQPTHAPPAPAPIIGVQQLGSNPATTTCPHCKNQVVTQLSYTNGMMTWVIVGVLFFFMVWPFCLIPFCVDGCKDIQHTCPSCQQFISLHKRM